MGVTIHNHLSEDQCAPALAIISIRAKTVVRLAGGVVGVRPKGHIHYNLRAPYAIT